MVKFILRHKIEALMFISGFFYFLFFSRYGIDIDDEGFHLYVSNLILKGFIPYKDFILHVTPGSFYLQALVFKIFTPAVMVGRLTVVFLGLYITGMLFKITKTIVRQEYFAAISGILFIFWGVSQIRHPWYGWYGLASGVTFLYFYLKYLNSKNVVYLFFTGLFCGLTFLMKQNLGIACMASYLAFLFISSMLSVKGNGGRAADFFKKQCVFVLGIAIAIAPFIYYFASQKALPVFLYYVFRFATFSAGGRLIFNPFPHVKFASMMVLLVFLAQAWLLYGFFWGKPVRKKASLLLLIIFAGVLIAGMTLFVVQINNVDNIYVLDHIKTGAVNGFFNLAMLAVLLGVFVILKKTFEKKYNNASDSGFLFIVLFCIFYIWASLCISRDHLHLVLGMPPAYILLSFMFCAGVKKIQDFLVMRNKAACARQYTGIAFCLFPLIFVSYFGFFTALKNEGFRSVFPPVVNMRSELNIPKARGIMVTREDKDTIEGIIGYIETHTSKNERIFDTYKSSLFYFLSDRVHPSFYYILHPDLFRPDKQEDVISDIIRYNVKLAITKKDLWDDLNRYANEKYNPSTYKIMGYMRDSFKAERQFGKYYILIKKL